MALQGSQTVTQHSVSVETSSCFFIEPKRNLFVLNRFGFPCYVLLCTVQIMLLSRVLFVHNTEYILLKSSNSRRQGLHCILIEKVIRVSVNVLFLVPVCFTIFE